jgi:hypothetical protein
MRLHGKVGVLQHPHPLARESESQKGTGAAGRSSSAWQGFPLAQSATPNDYDDEHRGTLRADLLSRVSSDSTYGTHP